MTGILKKSQQDMESKLEGRANESCAAFIIEEEEPHATLE